MATSRPTAGFGVLGLGAAACVACCAGPILGLLAATGIASVLGAAVFGVVGLVAVLVAAAVLLSRRRRRVNGCTPAPEAISLDVPRLTPRAPADSSGIGR